MTGGRAWGRVVWIGMDSMDPMDGMDPMDPMDTMDPMDGMDRMDGAVIGSAGG